MPKERQCRRDLFQKWIDSDPQFYGNLHVKDDDLFCNICERVINSSSKYKVSRHLNSHKTPSIQVEDAGFLYELTQAFVTSDIPFEKLNNPTFRAFLEKYIDRKIPEVSALRKGYIDEVYDDVIKAIREDISDNFVYFIIDETSDATGCSVANFLVGALKDNGASDNHLLASKVLDKSNHETIVNFVNDCFKYLWPDRDDYSDKILVMLTDTATYMVEAANILSKKYSYMIHFTCAVHALSSIEEEIKDCYPLVTKLISNVNKVFLKAPTRRDVFKEAMPDTALPPELIVTRCGTWLEAVAYYDEYFDGIKNVISCFDAQESNFILTSLDLINMPSLREDIKYINRSYSILISAMTKLETHGLSLNDQFATLNNIKYKINNNTGSINVTIREKMLKIFEENPGYIFLENIWQFLNGTSQELPTNLLKYSSCIRKFSYCPLSTIDAKRSYSLQELILSDRKRHSLTPENLEKLIVIDYERRTMH